MEGVDVLGFAVALGVGMLIGLERERSQHNEPASLPAGIRTFALTSLLGALASVTGSPLVIAAFGGIVGVLAALSYRQLADRDPGLTTEIALIVTYLLGVVSLRKMCSKRFDQGKQGLLRVLWRGCGASDVRRRET